MNAIPLTHLDAALERALVADDDALSAMLTSADATTLHAALLETSWRTPGLGRCVIGAALGRPRADLSPEGRLLQVQVTSARSGDVDALPDWRAWGLDPTLSTRWSALELARDPDAWLARGPDDIDIRRALSTIARDPDALLRAHPGLPGELVRASEDRCAATGLALLKPGMASGAISILDAIAALRGGLASPILHVLQGTLTHVTRPWAAHAWRDEAARATLNALARHADALVVTRAVDALAARRERDALELIARDASIDLGGRKAALRGLGLCADATRAHLSTILSVALEAPEILGEEALEALERLHRRGVFVEDASVEDVLTLFDTQNVRPLVVAGLLYTSREAARRALMSLPHGDSRWRRRVHLLAALEGGAPSLLELAASDAPVAPTALGLAGSWRVDGAEELALSRVERHTKDALFALRHVGGQRTCDALAAELGLGAPDGETAAHLVPYQGEAAALVWHLDDARRWRDALLARLDPSKLPDAIRRDLGARVSDAELELLTRSSADPEVTLVALCAHGGVECMDAIAQLLARVIDVTAARALEPVVDPHRGTSRLVETSLSEDTLGALRGYGARLHGRGVLRPAALAGPHDREDVGRFVANDLLCRTLRRRDDPHAQIVRVTLDALDGWLWPAEVQLALRWLRHEDPHVRKVTLRALARCHEDAGVTVRFVTMLRADDVQTVRAALDALSDEARVRTLPLDLIARALDHPNMNIKRGAARLLAASSSRVPGPDILDKLLFWLGKHDHEEFRASLREALSRALGGGGARAILTDAIQSAARVGDDRRASLLSGAIPDQERSPTRWEHATRGVTSSRDALARVAQVAQGAAPSIKLALAARARAIDPPALAAEPLRLRALHACGAHVTLEDLLACARDADLAEDPAATLEQTLWLFVEGAHLARGWRRDDLKVHVDEVVDAALDRRLQALAALWHAAIEHPAARPRYAAARARHMTVEAIWAALEADEPGERARAVGSALALQWAPALHAAALHAHVIGGVEAQDHALARAVWLMGQADLDAILDEAAQPEAIGRAIALASRSQRLDDWLLETWRSGPPRLAELAHEALSRRDATLVEPPSVVMTEAGRAALRVRASAEPELEWSAPTMRAKRAEALEDLTSHDVFEVLGALRTLGNHRDLEVEVAVSDLMDHDDPRVRDAARRTLKRVGSRTSYLEATASQLDDPRPDVRRSVIRVLAFAGYTKAAPAIVDAALDETHAGLRRAARDALALLGEHGKHAIEDASRRARPDMRRRLEALRDDVFPDDS